MTKNTSQEVIMPEAYKYGLVQWQEQDFTVAELTGFQSQMLSWILSTWSISPFPVEESKRLQDVKRERLWFFEARSHSSIPLRDMWTSENIDSILWNLDTMWARVSVFERYTEESHDPRELYLDDTLFRRLWLTAYKWQILWIIRWEISASIAPDVFLELTRNKLKALWCTDKYLNSFIKNNR